MARRKKTRTRKATTGAAGAVGATATAVSAAVTTEDTGTTGAGKTTSDEADMSPGDAKDVRGTEGAEGTVDAGTSGFPRWTDWCWERLGYVGGVLLFPALVLLVWPLYLVMVTMVVVMFGVYGVTTFPGLVSSGLDVPVGVLLSSTDSFVFSWIIPTLFLTLVFALVVYRLVVWLTRLLWEVTLQVRQGLYAGRGVTVRENLRDRKAARSRRRRKEAEAKVVKARAKAARRTEQAKVRAEAARAEASLRGEQDGNRSQDSRQSQDQNQGADESPDET